MHYGYDASQIGNAGLSAYFMFLAARLAKENGRVAAVLPRSTLSGVAFDQVRTAFLRDFHLEYVITNGDPGDSDAGVDPWNFSENTNLGGVMVIARRRPTIDESEQTLFLNLWRKPRNEVLSLLYAQQVVKKAQTLAGGLRDGHSQSVEADGGIVGMLYSVGRSDLKVNWLGPAVFASPHLNRLLLTTSSAPGLVTLKQLATGYGYDIRWLKDAFDKGTSGTPHRVIWGHQGSMNTLRMDPGHVGYGQARHGQKSYDIFEKYSSDLLIAERPHLSTESCLAFTVGQLVMGTAFWEVRLSEPKHASVIVLWLASTYGFTQFLSIATSSRSDIVKLKKDQLSELLVPNPADQDRAEWDALLEKVQSTPQGTYRQQLAAAAAGSGVRLEIDQFVSKAVGLKALASTDYELLARDPIISKQRL